MDGRTDGWMDGRTEGRTDWMDGNRKADIKLIGVITDNNYIYITYNRQTDRYKIIHYPSLGISYGCTFRII
jgi:hypothetical protein